MQDDRPDPRADRRPSAPTSIKIGKLNIDDNLATQARFDVMSIPTLILFKGGEPILRLVGAKGKGQLLEELDRYL